VLQRIDGRGLPIKSDEIFAIEQPPVSLLFPFFKGKLGLS